MGGMILFLQPVAPQSHICSSIPVHPISLSAPGGAGFVRCILDFGRGQDRRQFLLHRFQFALAGQDSLLHWVLLVVVEFLVAAPGYGRQSAFAGTFEPDMQPTKRLTSV